MMMPADITLKNISGVERSTKSNQVVQINTVRTIRIYTDVSQS